MRILQRIPYLILRCAPKARLEGRTVTTAKTNR